MLDVPNSFLTYIGYYIEMYEKPANIWCYVPLPSNVLVLVVGR